jgi:hypothetical protein
MVKPFHSFLRGPAQKLFPHLLVLPRVTFFAKETFFCKRDLLCEVKRPSIEAKLYEGRF